MVSSVLIVGFNSMRELLLLRLRHQIARLNVHVIVGLSRNYWREKLHDLTPKRLNVNVQSPFIPESRCHAALVSLEI